MGLSTNKREKVMTGMEAKERKGMQKGIANASLRTKSLALVARKSGSARTTQIPHTTSTNLLGPKPGAREAKEARAKEREKEGENAGIESKPLLVALNSGSNQQWRQSRCFNRRGP